MAKKIADHVVTSFVDSIDYFGNIEIFTSNLLILLQ